MDQPDSEMDRSIRRARLPFGTLVDDGLILITQFIRKIAVAAVDETIPERPTYLAPGTPAALERVGHAFAGSARRRGGHEIQQAGTSVEEMILSRLVEDGAQQICEMIRESARVKEKSVARPDPVAGDQNVADEAK